MLVVGWNKLSSLDLYDAPCISSKRVVDVVQGGENCPVVVNTNIDGIDFVEDVDHPTHAHDIVSIVPNAKQLR